MIESQYYISNGTIIEYGFSADKINGYEKYNTWIHRIAAVIL